MKNIPNSQSEDLTNANDELAKLFGEINDYMAEIMDDLKDKSLEIYNNVMCYYQKLESITSTTLKDIITKNYNLGGRMMVNFATIAQLYKKYAITLYHNGEKRSDDIQYNISQNVQHVSEIIKLTESADDEVTKDFYRTQAQVTYVLSQKLIDTYELHNELDVFNQYIILSSIWLCMYSCYMPFTLNDYNKYKLYKEKFMSMTKTIAGLIPALSIPIAITNLSSDAAECINIYDDKVFEEKLFSNTDNHLIILESQTTLLTIGVAQQMNLIDSLKKLVNEPEDE